MPEKKIQPMPRYTLSITKDIKGSTMSLWDESGQRAVSYTYDDFGKTSKKPADGNTDKQGEENEICYTGGVYDETTEQ